MNLGDLRTAVAAATGLDTSDASELALLDRWINEGVVDVLRRTRCYQEMATMALTAGLDGDYTLDSDVLQILDIWIDSDEGPLTRVTPEEMLHLRRAASNDGVSRYALAGSNLFMVYPEPSADVTAHLLVVPRPTKLSQPAHDPSTVTYGGIPEELHPLVEMYATFRAGLFRRDASISASGLYQIYEAEALRAARDTSAKGGRKLAPVKPGHRGGHGRSRTSSNGRYPA